jgi:hypothetical protein
MYLQKSQLIEEKDRRRREKNIEKHELFIIGYNK